MITHLLDTSAILAHYFRENGGVEVNEILHSSSNIGISVVSLVELKTRFVEACADPREIERAFRLYADEILHNIPVDRSIADIAIQIRAEVRPRIPLVDSLIAATAQINGAILVHRDPHFAAIPTDKLRQILLPAK